MKASQYQVIRQHLSLTVPEGSQHGVGGVDASFHPERERDPIIIIIVMVEYNYSTQMGVPIHWTGLLD